MAFRTLNLQTVNRFVLALDRGVTEVTVSNSTTETSLFSTVIPGSTLGDEKCLRGSFFGKLTGRDPGLLGDGFTLRVKLGGTTIFTDVRNTNTSAAPNQTFGFQSEFHIIGTGTVGTQKGFSTVSQGVAASGLAGSGRSSSDAIAINEAINQATAGDLTFEITAQGLVAHADISITFYGIFLELI